MSPLIDSTGLGGVDPLNGCFGYLNMQTCHCSDGNPLTGNWQLLSTWESQSQFWLLISNKAIQQRHCQTSVFDVRSETSSSPFQCFGNNNNRKTPKMHKHGFLKGLGRCFLAGSGHTQLHPVLFFTSPSSPLVFWFCIMRLMTCQLTEVRLFSCAHRWVPANVCVHVQTFICIRLWSSTPSRVYRARTLVLTRVCAPTSGGGLRIPV